MAGGRSLLRIRNPPPSQVQIHQSFQQPNVSGRFRPIIPESENASQRSPASFLDDCRYPAVDLDLDLTFFTDTCEIAAKESL